MRIERIFLHTFELKLRFPFETSFGRWTHRRGIIVVAEGEGLRGYGEVTAHEEPLFSYETLGTAREMLLGHLGPACLRVPVARAADLTERLAFVRGHPMAKAGLEGAVRDLLAKRDGVSLSAQIGGTRRTVESGVSLGIEATPEALVERARTFADRGYRRIKIKIRPGRDREPLGAVRSALPGRMLAADANAAYRLGDTPALAALDDLDLAMIEQPLAWDDLVDHAELRRRVRTPICLDESIAGPAAARAALALGSASIFNVKLGRVGGMTAAIAIHDLARAAGVPVWCGGMLESCIGRLHNLALASLPGFSLPGDLSGSDRYFDVDLVEPPIRVRRDGTLAVPDGPGIGAQVDEPGLRRITLRTDAISPAPREGS
jgi:O-succinylbenzoate synthase